jgi:cyclic beta-1,2-glucan synthetase
LNAAESDATRRDASAAALAVGARALAGAHHEVRRARGTVLPIAHYLPSPIARALERARTFLSTGHPEGAAAQKASEWFLDNYYLVRRVARQTRQDLPPGFIARLPVLVTGDDEGVARVDALANAIVSRNQLSIDATALRSFVDAYQEVSPLTIAELWALPTMLRVSVLRGLLHYLEALHVPVHGLLERAPSRAPDLESLGLSPVAGVERSIRALRLLSELDWEAFFESTSRVEAILGRDPAAVYSRMDFETCDGYRKLVEVLAWETGVTEPDVAEHVVALARLHALDPRSGHVGYYLLDAGRRELETRIGYRPGGVEGARRVLLRVPTFAYLSGLALGTGLLVLALCLGLARTGAAPLVVYSCALLALVPASVAAVTLVQWGLSRLLSPRLLPKLDFEGGLPADCKCAVVIPTLLGRIEDVDGMLRQIELHYLSNRDPLLEFALLTDDVDARAVREDGALLDRATRGVAALNAAHGGDAGGPFHLLHRAPRWNAAEERFMGWERKRGKLEEWNRLLRGAKDTSFTQRAGNAARLEGIRFVITVDSDTQLPMGAARRLVGTLAHPLNRATFDDRSGRVVSGYTIVQPRIEMSPSSARATRFSRIFGGDVGFDIYTHAVSESYQDLFGAGIYVGKGIYEVDAFMRSVEGRVPENALASHDLFEGIAGRVGLASDIVLFEDYPAHYVAYARRMHRWVRGDWQLLPWVWPVVPSADGARSRSALTTIDRWKIVDNVRRSLTGPAVFLLLVLGLTWLPGSAVLWTLGTLALLLFPSLPGLVQGRRRGMNLARCALAVVFLAHETALVIDAVARVIVRMTITRKHLLQWTSAAHAAFGLGARSPRWLLWREMIASPCLALAVTLLVARARPSALPVAAPLVLLWLLAPEIARWVSGAASPATEPLRGEDRRRLRLLARRTWRFFDVFVGPNDQWLPIDNTQEAPYPQQAHRTSPTNIGMMLLSTLAAYDLGYLGATELSLRLRSAFDSIKNLVHYQGHLLNWYGTKDLQPLLPRYVSTVDSGNFAGCLVALAQGCRQVAKGPVLRAAAWQAISDSLDLLEQDLASVPASKSQALTAVVTRMRRALEQGQGEPSGAYETLRVLCDDDGAALDRELLALLDTGALRHDADTLRALRMSIERFHQQLRQTRYEVDLLLPWLPLKHEAAVLGLLPRVHLRLDEVPQASCAMIEQIARWRIELRARGEPSLDGESCAERLTEALARSASRAEALAVELTGIASRADAEVLGMDFRLLYDPQRKLFHIGYNATQDQLDAHHYDLLASEARLASYLAIVKGDVPEEHWAELGRPMTQVSGAPLLLSWGGTMFEYLMPALLMRSRPETLLAQTGELVVDAHIAYGVETDAPWGISESGHARRDASHTYQYQSFGVPGLGFRRGLEEDLVVAPYACVLAASVRPRAVLANLERLEGMGMLGTYGLFEAVDMRPEGADEGRPFAVVRSHMAHHQGMILVALDNLLNEQIMVERFHADRLVETGEILLNERAPAVAPREWPRAVHADASPLAPAGDASPAPSPWPLDSRDRPRAFVLSNGRLSSVLTAAGGGGLRWRGLAVTRYQPDVVGAGDGLWIHVRDQDSGRQWIATSEGGRTTFEVHKAEFHQRDEGVSVHVEVSVAPAGDVEVRLITLHNETQRTRNLRVSSVAEPVLLPLHDAATHPAFGRLFLESEWVEPLGALIFSRRPQSPTQPAAVLVHRLVGDGPSVRPDGHETDRAAFFGRCGTAAMPASLSRDRRPEDGRAGAVLDPVLSLSALVELAPQQSVTFAFVTSVARTRSAALDLARRYGSMHTVRWALRDADQEGRRRLARVRLSPELLPAVSQLFSALLFADRTMRAPQAVLAVAHPCKSHLWGHGISGDDPIVLVRVHDSSAPLVSEVLAAQAYLRACGVSVELVLLDESATGYLGDAAGALRQVLVTGKVEEWLGKRGGIFVLSADQLKGAERADVEAAARVVLDTTGGGLASAMAKPVEPPARLPRFEPTRVEEAVPRAPTRPALLFDNGAGGFTEDGRQYVISVRPGSPTPAPWCNVLCNPDFGCLVSESSLGSTWSLNAGENRLTPWRNDPVFDTPSEVLYLRDEETAAIWSPTPLPAGGDGETLVRHGAGYTTYVRETHGLEQELTVFVPDDAPVKLVRLKLRNNLARHRRLTATYYAEWVLGSLREGQRAYVKSELDEPNACLLATCSWNAEFASRVAFLASELPLHGFATDRAEFLGRRGDLARPEALERWGLAGRIEAGVDPCAAVQVHLELGPGEEIETHFVLGQAAGREEAMALVGRFRKADAVATAWQQLGSFWDGLLGSVQVKTPEPAMDLMLNRWLLYQTLSARLFGRTAFYQSSGAFGFRDQLQDVLALLHAAPDRARAHILEAARHQFLEGDVLHWWHPPAGRGVRTRCSDDLAWLPFITAEYVLSTGDASILSEPVAFLAGNPLRDDEDDRYAEFTVSPHSASLFDHCRLALVHADTHGPHGLPLMGGGDWNDGMNRVGAEGRGESVWLAWFLCATMDRFAALCERRGEGVDAAAWRSRSAELRDAIELGAWDGAWYVRAFHDDGSVLGSDTGRECRIDSIAQSWAVLSRVRGEPLPAQHRARRAVQAADERLVDEPDRLIRLLWPPFDLSSHDPGYIGAYPPGIRENGGQYTHAATWLGWAYVELGEGTHAERIFRLLNPVLRASTRATSELYRIEPYVLAGDVYAVTPWVGRGGWSWYTGAAAWAYRLGVEGILGLRREEGVLRIDPCIPAGWSGFEAWVRVGAQRVHVVVDNAAGAGRGIASLTLDGVSQDSNRIALDANATGTREVRVELVRTGRAASHAAE